MRIKSLVETTINGIKIYPGVDNYPLDHKDPMTADQLLVLRDTMKKINFGELLYCDLKDFDPKEGPKPFEKMEERTKAYKAQCKEEAEGYQRQRVVASYDGHLMGLRIYTYRIHGLFLRIPFSRE